MVFKKLPPRGCSHSEGSLELEYWKTVLPKVNLIPREFMPGVSISRKCKRCQPPRRSKLAIRIEKPGDVATSVDTPWLEVARHTQADYKSFG